MVSKQVDLPDWRGMRQALEAIAPPAQPDKVSSVIGDVLGVLGGLVVVSFFVAWAFGAL